MAIGELARVDYKGSASFRIVQPDAKSKRRRRCPRPPIVNVPTPPPVSVPHNGPMSLPPPMRPPSALQLGSPHHPPPGPPGGLFAPPPTALPPPPPQAECPPLTLRTLVIEMLGESATASIESGVTVTPQFIAKAIEASPRQIYRAAILANLDLILAKEIEVGNFIKVGEDQFRLSPFPSPFQSQHSLLALNPPLAHPPPAPLPVQQLLMEPPEGLLPSSPPPRLMAPPPHPPTPPMPPALAPPHPSVVNTTGGPPMVPTAPGPSPSPPSPQISIGPSDEQRKNDLIAAKLSKLEGKSKSPSKKVASGDKNRHRTSLSAEAKKEPCASLSPAEMEDLPLTVARTASAKGMTEPMMDEKASMEEASNAVEAGGKGQANQSDTISANVGRRRKVLHGPSFCDPEKKANGFSADSALALSRSGSSRKKVTFYSPSLTFLRYFNPLSFANRRNREKSSTQLIMINRRGKGKLLVHPLRPQMKPSTPMHHRRPNLQRRKRKT